MNMKAEDMQPWEIENAKAVHDARRPLPWVAWFSAVAILGLAVVPDATVAVLLVVGLVSVWRAFHGKR